MLSVEEYEERMDALRDEERKSYKVTVTVKFEYVTAAKDVDEAESDAYDDIENVLKGSYLDYEFYEFDTEERG